MSMLQLGDVVDMRVWDRCNLTVGLVWWLPSQLEHINLCDSPVPNGSTAGTTSNIYDLLKRKSQCPWPAIGCECINRHDLIFKDLLCKRGKDGIQLQVRHLYIGTAKQVSLWAGCATSTSSATWKTQEEEYSGAKETPTPGIIQIQTEAVLSYSSFSFSMGYTSPMGYTWVLGIVFRVKEKSMVPRTKLKHRVLDFP